jgi:hypothetical protein
MQTGWTPVKGLPKQEEEVHTLPDTKHQQRMKGKELHAHVRSLLAQMEEKDKEYFFDDAAKEGF